MPAAPVSNAVAFAVSNRHALAIRPDGTVVAWGISSLLTNVPLDLSNVVAISAGGYHSLALKTDGTVMGWGSDTFFEYNTGQATVPAGLSNVIAIACGGYHSLALKADGTITGWGLNGNGQATPPSGLSNVVGLSSHQDAYHSLALKSDGKVVGWGNNYRGQITIPASLNSVRAIAAGYNHSLALRSNGTVVAWGANDYGEGSVPVGLSNVVAIAAGEGLSVALKSDRRIVAWGSNLYGQTNIPTGLTNVIGIAANFFATYALVADSPFIESQPTNQMCYTGMSVVFNVRVFGAEPFVYRWQFNGTNIVGATNDSLLLTNVQSNKAGNYRVIVSNAFESVVSSNATLTVLASSPIVEAQPTNQTVWLRRSVTLAATISGSWPLHYQWQFEGTNIAGATNSSLVLTNAQFTNEGHYRLTASNALGQVTTSSAYLTVTKVAVWGGLSEFTPPAHLGDVTAVAALRGAPTIFALRSNGTVAAWGDNSYGQTNVPPDLTNVISLAAGYAHVIALKRDGTVVGWGNNDAGQMTSPPNLSNVVAIASESFHNLALKSDGTVVGWGDNIAGQATPPTNLLGVIDIDCGNQTSYALRRDGTVVGWGNGFSGQMNIPSDLGNVVDIAADTYHGCALREDGTIRIWGLNNFAIPGTGVLALVTGSGNCIGLTRDGSLVQLLYPISFPANLKNVIAVDLGNCNVALLGDGAPVVLRHPVSRSVQTNYSTSLTVAALGDPPLQYQWQLNGTNVLGATNSTLVFTNVQWAHEGAYRVFVTNAFGNTTSAPAFLNAVDFSEILSTPNLTWTTGGDAPWFLQTTIAHDRTMAAQSGAIVGGALNQSTLQTSVTGPGTLKFWWKTATIGACSPFYFYVNDVATYGIWADTDWTEQTLYLPTGSYGLLWNYIKNCGDTSSAGKAWLDDVSYTPGVTLPTVTSAPSDKTVSAGLNTTFSVAAVGTPPLRYQWQLNGANLLGATNTSILITNAQQANAGVYTALVINDYGTSAPNANLTINPALSISSQPASQRKVVHSLAVFSVVAKGSEPFSYQWQFNGTNINYATNSTLALDDLKVSDSGNYQVIITNAAGTLSSSNASLTVSPTLVVGWGYHVYGQTNAPAALTNPAAIAAGMYHSLALRTDGTITVWGDNTYRQTNAPAGLTNVTAISAGLYHNLALKSDGTVAAWGAGTNITFSPNLGQSTIPTGLSNVVAIAGGGYHTTALKADGAVISWGNNTYGQTNAPGGLSNVVAIAAGQYHNLALSRDGIVAAWGAGTNVAASPRLGQSKVPVGLSNVIAVAAGGFHSVALKGDGTIIAWGSNTYGQTNTPASLTNAVAISAGLYHTMAIRSDGSTIAWGAGTNTTAQPHFSQSKIPTGLSNVVGTAGGGYHSLALVTDGSPFVVRQPWNWQMENGGNVSFKVIALGTPTMSYQWKLNGSPLTGETNSILVLTNVPLSYAGNFQCFVSNSLGFVHSSSAILTVLRTSPEFETQILTGEGFELHLKRLSGHGEIILYASTNLLEWQPLFTNPPVMGTLKLLDPVATNLPTRFYRAEER